MDIPALVTAASLNLLHRLAYTATRCRRYDGINLDFLATALQPADPFVGSHNLAKAALRYQYGSVKFFVRHRSGVCIER